MGTKIIPSNRQLGRWVSDKIGGICMDMFVSGRVSNSWQKASFCSSGVNIHPKHGGVETTRCVDLNQIFYAAFAKKTTLFLCFPIWKGPYCFDILRHPHHIQVILLQTRGLKVQVNLARCNSEGRCSRPPRQRHSRPISKSDRARKNTCSRSFKPTHIQNDFANDCGSYHVIIKSSMISIELLKNAPE